MTNTKKPNRKLNYRQKLFVKEYLKDFNGTQSAIRAGYSLKTARFIATELLTKPNIQSAIQDEMDKRAKRLELDADSILREITRIAYVDIADYVAVEDGIVKLNYFKDMPEGATRVIKRIKQKKTTRLTENGQTVEDSTLEYEFHDKLKALELACKHLGLLEGKKDPLHEPQEGQRQHPPGDGASMEDKLDYIKSVLGK